MIIEPPGVNAARARAEACGFELSCENEVGSLLATLASAVRAGGTIVELGTGAGVGLAWIVHGVGERRDVSVHTVDIDGSLLTSTAAAGWPDYVHFVEGDGARVVRELAPIDLIFADAAGGKIEGLEGTIAALRPGGLLVVDDMNAAAHGDDGFLDAIERVRATLLEDARLVVAELDFSSGVLLCGRRR